MDRALGPSKPEVLAERGPGVTVAEDAASLELRYHQSDHILVGAR
jgi:hypothetical protein